MRSSSHATTPTTPAPSTRVGSLRARAAEDDGTGGGTIRATDLSYPDPELTEGGIRLRRWAETDIGCVEQASHDPRIPEATTVPASYTAEEGRAFVRRQWSRLTAGQGVSLAIAEVATDRAIGLAYLSTRPQPGVAGLGYWVVPGARRRGHATRAADLLTSWGLSHLGLVRVEAWVEPDNLASQRTLLAAGFRREGVLRRFLLLGDRRADAVVLSRIADP